MKKDFDFYEFTGVLVPGVATMTMAALVWPGHAFALKELNVSMGELGLFLTFAYVAGHLVQAFGNILEHGYWILWSGMPTDWLRTQKHPFLSQEQRDLLPIRIRSMLGLETFNFDDGLSKKDWSAICRQIGAAVYAENRGSVPVQTPHPFDGYQPN